MIYEMVVDDRDNVLGKRKLKHRGAHSLRLRLFRPHPILKVNWLVHNESIAVVRARNTIIFAYDIIKGGWKTGRQDMAYVKLHSDTVQRIEVLFDLQSYISPDFVKEMKAAIVEMIEMLKGIKFIKELFLGMETSPMARFKGQIFLPLAEIRGVGDLIVEKYLVTPAVKRYLKEMMQSSKTRPHKGFVREEYTRAEVSLAEPLEDPRYSNWGVEALWHDNPTEDHRRGRFR